MGMRCAIAVCVVLTATPAWAWRRPEERPIHQAAARGDVAEVKRLLRKDPQLVAATDRRRRTALHVRRDKAALIQRVQAPPGDRSSRKQPGQAWR